MTQSRAKESRAEKSQSFTTKAKKTTFVEKSTRVFVVVLVLRISSAN